MIGGVKTSLKKNNAVSLVGFGTFSVGKRAARSGRNPRTGAAIKIKGGQGAEVRAGKALKDASTERAQSAAPARRGCLAQLVERRPHRA